MLSLEQTTIQYEDPLLVSKITNSNQPELNRIWSTDLVVRNTYRMQTKITEHSVLNVGKMFEKSRTTTIKL